MKNQCKDLQDTFLNHLRRGKVKVCLHLNNKQQIEGEIRGFDNFVIILESEGKQQLIYKHSIAAIIPDKKINYAFKEEKEE